nr:MerR family transcriptional regulator [Burkholderia ubonensis]
MPLTVGMLARRCGITVRALHYYDQTGLLKPIGRSTSGYRLYDEASVSTIRTIQALRGLGLTLDAIAQMLRNRQIALAEVIAESRLAIDAELARLNTLNERLGVLQAACDSGVTWLDADWPETLALLERYRAHFGRDCEDPRALEGHGSGLVGIICGRARRNGSACPARLRRSAEARVSLACRRDAMDGRRHRHRAALAAVA